MHHHNNIESIMSVLLINASAFAITHVNDILGACSLSASLVYTSIKIYKTLKNKGHADN